MNGLVSENLKSAASVSEFDVTLSGRAGQAGVLGKELNRVKIWNGETTYFLMGDHVEPVTGIVGWGTDWTLRGTAHFIEG